MKEKDAKGWRKILGGEWSEIDLIDLVNLIEAASDVF